MRLRLLFQTLYEVSYGINVVDRSRGSRATAASATINRTNIVIFFQRVLTTRSPLFVGKLFQ